MRTDEEILKRIRHIKDSDWMGQEKNDLIFALSYKTAKEKKYMRKETKEEKWEEMRIVSPEESINFIESYMPFAWDKANNFRGLSVSRAISHMAAYLFLYGMNFAPDQIKMYRYYGKPRFRAICEYFDWDWKQWDNGIWANDDPVNLTPVPEKVEPLLEG